jgi:acetylornithine deacetylase
MKWQPSWIPLDHPLVTKGIEMGRKTFGSPTLSDQVHFACPTLKMGPGVSERSHTPDEFIKLSELREGIELYIRLLDGLKI